METTLEGLALVDAWIAVAEPGTTFLVGLAAIGGVLSGLETAAKIAFVLVEIASGRLVGFFLRIAEADPPHFAGAINAFGASIFQSAANGFSLLVIGGDSDDCGVALSQSVFVDEQFVFGKSVSGGAFYHPASTAACDGTENAPCEAHGHDWTDARHEKTSEDR